MIEVSCAFSQAIKDVKDIEHDKLYFLIENSIYLEDTTRLSIDSVRKINSRRFKSIREKQMKNFGFASGYYWFKFGIRNSDTLSKSCVFIVGNMIVKEMELFVGGPMGLKSLGKSGINIPLMDRPEISNYFVYPVVIAPKSENTYYLFIDIKGDILLLSLELHNLSNFKYEGYRLFIIFGIFIGILMLALLLNVVLFIFTRDRLHVFYSINAFFSILLLMSQESLNSLFFHPGNFYLNQFSRHTVACWSLFSSFVVMRVFLDQRPGNSRYYWLVTVMLGFYMITPFIEVFVTVFHARNLLLKRIYWYLLVSVIIAGYPIALLSCIEKLRQGFKQALFFLIAISAPLLGAALMAARQVLSHFVYRPPNLFEIGVCLKSVIICIGILYRYNLYKKQKENLTQALEKEKLESAEQVLLVQEDERKRIAADLHDELGGNLAAIKMTLQSFRLPEDKTNDLIQLIDSASTNARNISHNLMPPEFEDTTLIDLLSHHYQHLNKEGYTLFNFHCSGTAYSFNKHKELMLYRILLEITSNIIKHAEASEATVQLIYYESYLEIMAEDDGRGFSNGAVDGIGLKNIRSRVNYLNGTISIDSNPNGTTMMIQVPYKTL